MSFQLDLQSGISQQNAGDFCQLLAGAGLQRVLVEVEENVINVDDQAAGGFSRFEDHVQLLAQPFTKLGLLGFGLLGGLA